MKYKLRLVLTQIALNVSIFLGIYLIKTFVIWELENPLKWLIDLPKYSADCRGVIIFIYPFLQIPVAMLNTYLNKKYEPIRTTNPSRT